MQFHPENIRKLGNSEFLAISEDIQNVYGDLQNFIADATSWYEVKTNNAVLAKPVV